MENLSFLYTKNINHKKVRLLHDSQNRNYEYNPMEHKIRALKISKYTKPCVFFFAEKSSI